MLLSNRATVILSCIVAALSFATAENAPKNRHWSVALDGGWQAAISLQKPDPTGRKRGNFFWLTNEHDILWNEDERTITVYFVNLSYQKEASADTQQVVFLKEKDGLKWSKESLSTEEFQALGTVLWKPGGSQPEQLGSFHDRNSPYSRSHERGDFILDVNTVPMPFARHALRVFWHDDRTLMPWIAHRELTSEAFHVLLAETKRPITKNDEKALIRVQSIRQQLAQNPSLPRDVLEDLWRQPIVSAWGGGACKLEIARHAKADANWYPKFLNMLDSDAPEAATFRVSLGSYQKLPADLLDLLIRRIRDRFDAEKLASRKDLQPHQIRTLIEKHPWDVYPSLISSGLLPEDRYGDAIDLGSQDIMQEIIWSKKSPQSAVVLVLEKRVTSPEFYGRHSERDALQEAVAHRLLPERLHKLHVAHPFPEIRASLAGNPSLSSPVLRLLAADSHAVVAQAAREQLTKKAEEASQAFLTSLPALETLNPARSMREDIDAALVADDTERFEQLRKSFEDKPGDNLIQNAIKAQAIACLRDQLARKNWTAESLASYAAGEKWTQAMTELVLTPPVTPETIEAYAFSLSQRGKAEDFQLLLDRGHKLRSTTEPIAWLVVMRRDREMLEKIAKLDAPLNLPNDGMTPAQLAVRIRFLGALGILPLDEKAQKELAAFRKKFPGDDKAPWLGDWTNGKGEFQTLVLRFNADGSGALITATGIGAMTAWRSDPKETQRFAIHLFDDNGKEEAQALEADWKNGTIELKLPNRVETFQRPAPPR